MATEEYPLTAVSVGAGIAIRRLSEYMDRWDCDTENALVRLLEDLRSGLAADNVVAIVALVLLQDMIQIALQTTPMQDVWVVLMLGCWSVACKLCYDEPVHSRDIVDAWNNSCARPVNVTAQDVHEAEYFVVRSFHWNSIKPSTVSFRSGILRVLIQQPRHMSQICRTQSALRVLIIDDCKFHVLAHRIAVCNACSNADVKEAASYAEAIQSTLYAEWIPDVILIDLVMPHAGLYGGGSQHGGAIGDEHTMDTGVLLAHEIRSHNTQMLLDVFNGRISINPWSERNFNPSDVLIVGLSVLEFSEPQQNALCADGAFDAMCTKPFTAPKARAILGMAWRAQA
jgi:CheY-like chemotaxis protein